MRTIEKWEMLELTFYGIKDGNPYIDCRIKAIFTGKSETVAVAGFYDGDGVYKVRFMPSYEGNYHYEVSGQCLSEDANGDEKSGLFFVEPARPGNHGPVRVRGKQYLAYADGTPYHSVGTTCYAWIHQSEELQKQTINTLADSCFNKLRFCVFPKYYQYNETEPVSYPYRRGQQCGQDPDKAAKKLHIIFPTKKVAEDITDFDCCNFNEVYFQKLDRRIEQLKELGIEADLILFHPYDKWGFCTMNKECNELYLKYMAARYGACRNVWWSLANEYDLTTSIEMKEWDEYGRLIQKEDPFAHLRSIHNCMAYYDYTKDWITHCSMQKNDTYKHVEETEKHINHYQKPVVWDEIVYEGNIDMGWGNISGQELVRRFWESMLRGGCAGHGETFVHPQDILWWSHGGVLYGDSEPRISFLKKIWDAVPGGYLKYANGMFDEVVAVTENEEKVSNWIETTWCDFELHYYGIGRPSYRMFSLPETSQYQIEIIDTWNMTVTDAGIHSGQTKIDLPGYEYIAIRLTKISF